MHTLLQFGRDRPNKGIRAPKILSKMANINDSDVLWPDYSSVACLLLRMDAHSCLTFALEELAVSRLQSTRTHLSGDWTCKKSHNTCMWETPTPYSQLHSQEAQLSPRDRAMRRVSWNLANCHTTVLILLVRQVLNQVSADTNWPVRQNRTVDRAWRSVR